MRSGLLVALWAAALGAVTLFLVSTLTPQLVASAAGAGRGPEGDVSIRPTLAGTADGEDSGARQIEVARGMSADAIAKLLEERAVVTDARRFDLLLAYSGAAAELQSGCYEFTAGAPAAEVIRRLREGLTTNVALAVPEGLRLEEIGERAERLGVATPAQWNAAIETVRAEGLPPGRPQEVGLLGYLLPAAYPVECSTDATALVRAMTTAFSERVTPELVAEAEAQGLTLHEVLTIASIVEREAVVKEERPLIASAFRNRLDDGSALDADPTVQFAIATPESVAEHGWWKRALTLDDLAADSPYNTYVVNGLPPGPIANPGFDAIVATIRPAQTDYLYFVARGDGTHAFASTLAEHNANVERYILNP